MITPALHPPFFAQNQNTNPNKYSMMEQSMRNKGDHAMNKSLRVAVSWPSKVNKSIVESITDITAVMAELQRNPSETWASFNCVGWNSVKDRTARDSPPTRALIMFRVL